MSIFDKIKRGDLIFTRSESYMGKVIRFVTKSNINHVAIYLGDDKIIESQLGFGVRYYELLKYIDDKNCEVSCGNLIQIDSKQIEKAIESAENLLNSPYDLIGQAGILLKIIIVRIGLNGLVKFYGRNFAQNINAFWCSELVAYSFEKAESKLTDVDQRYASPQDLAESKKIKFNILN